jgi:hypothetical protein
MRTRLSPVIQAVFLIQEQKEKDLNLKESLSSNDGCFHSSICVNAETKRYHTVYDCTYTLISIPKQSKSSQSLMKYDFLLVKKTSNLCLTMISHIAKMNHFQFKMMIMTKSMQVLSPLQSVQKQF